MLRTQMDIGRRIGRLFVGKVVCLAPTALSFMLKPGAAPKAFGAESATQFSEACILNNQNEGLLQ